MLIGHNQPIKLLIPGLGLLSVICFSWMCIGCGPKSRVPERYLQPQKMQAVLWDLMRSDQFLSDYVFARDTAAKKRDLSFDMYARIFAIHKITPEQFRASFVYYHDHPELLKEVMDSMNKKSIFPQSILDTTPKLPEVTIPVSKDSAGSVTKDTLLVKPKLKMRPRQ